MNALLLILLDDGANCTAACANCMELWITVTPIILFVGFTFVLYINLKKSGVKLTLLLEEKDVVISYQKSVNKAAETGTNPPPQPQPASSISRLVALITGLTAVIMAICLTAFWIFEYAYHNKDVDYSHLTSLLLALGIGVVPYGFNRISSAFNNK